MPVAESVLKRDFDLCRPLFAVVVRFDAIGFHSLDQQFAIRADDREFFAELFLCGELVRECFMELLAFERREGRLECRDLGVGLRKLVLDRRDLLGVLPARVLVLKSLKLCGEGGPVLASSRQIILKVALTTTLGSSEHVFLYTCKP